MKVIKEPLQDKNGFVAMFKIDDFEYVNPIEKDRNTIINMKVNMTLNSLQLSDPKLYEGLKYFPNLLISIQNDALEYFNKNYEEIKSIQYPAQLDELLFSGKKKIQIKILEGLKLESNQLQAFIYSAWENHRFTYSMYTVEHPPKGINENEMPRMAIKNDDNFIQTFGETNYSQGELRRAIEHRRTTISKFLDNGNIWHCFFYTYKSIGGKEIGGIPHIHYISSTWGLSREYVLYQLRSNGYNLPATPHIPYKRH